MSFASTIPEKSFQGDSVKEHLSSSLKSVSLVSIASYAPVNTSEARESAKGHDCTQSDSLNIQIIGVSSTNPLPDITDKPHNVTTKSDITSDLTMKTDTSSTGMTTRRDASSNMMDVDKSSDGTVTTTDIPPNGMTAITDILSDGLTKSTDVSCNVMKTDLSYNRIATRKDTSVNETKNSTDLSPDEMTSDQLKVTIHDCPPPSELTEILKQGSIFLRDFPSKNPDNTIIAMPSSKRIHPRKRKAHIPPLSSIYLYEHWLLFSPAYSDGLNFTKGF